MTTTTTTTTLFLTCSVSHMLPPVCACLPTMPQYVGGNDVISTLMPYPHPAIISPIHSLRLIPSKVDISVIQYSHLHYPLMVPTLPPVTYVMYASILHPTTQPSYPKDGAASLTWSLDGSVITSGGNDDNIFLWCMTHKMKKVHYRFAHQGGITGLEFDSRNSSVSSSEGG